MSAEGVWRLSRRRGRGGLSEQGTRRVRVAGPSGLLEAELLASGKCNSA